MTVLEVIKRSAEFLDKRGVESPRLQVELLLAHLLQVPRMGLYLNFERVLTAKELEDLREMVKRRGQREPLQHIIGSVCFCGLELAVNSSVLVPRPETELLAEAGWKFLEVRSAECGVRSEDLAEAEVSGAGPGGKMPPSTAGGTPAATITALDFGTGSGCLAIALAWKCPEARVTAIEISREALAVARENAARHKVEARIRFVEGDGFGRLAAGERFDLMVGNPPYIASAEIPTLEPEVRDHDPRGALDGGAEGLDFYHRLAREGGDFLKPGGRMMLEFGAGQANAIKAIFEVQKWIVEAVKADYNGHSRILIAHRDA